MYRPMNRREFLKAALATAGACSLGNVFAAAAVQRKTASDVISLGSGVKATRLAMGTGSHGWNGSSNQTRQLGIKGLADLLQAGFDNGVTFWDSADQYGSHPHLKEALKRVGREKVTVLTKTCATTADEMKKDLDRFRRELGTDYIDILLLHCMEDGNWPEMKRGAMDVISEAREAGIVKMHGVSCHSIEALKTAAATDWVQIDLARINPAGAWMDASPERVIPVLREMKAKGKAVIGMKILGNGKLRDRMDECLQFALDLDCVDCFSIGCESYGQFAEIVKKIPAASMRG